MCGLVGFLQPAGIPVSFGEETIRRQTNSLAHRGPDDSGFWLDGPAGIALGHRRLAVLELSPAGHQPMLSESGRYVLAYNGEIYNYVELREAITTADSASAWRGHSDTETLLAGFERWGIEATLQKAVGMFALALWDRKERVLTLARDRLGEKPLYYGWQGGAFLFASEIKALRQHTAFRAEIDRDALATYVRDGYIAAPCSIYRGVRKLLPGTYLRLSSEHRPGTWPEPKEYWSLRAVAEAGRAGPFSGDDVAVGDELEAVLTRAIALQCVADVPLGAFLSGGIDSTTVVALLQAQSSQPVKTFTIGFRESAYQEAQYAKAIAKHLGTDHTELYVTAREAMEVIPKLPFMYDEPFGDSSAIPTFLVAQLARRRVTVSLSGDGGDELFGGYTRYQRTADIWRRLRPVPHTVRTVLSRSCGAAAKLASNSSVAAKAERLAQYLSARTADDCYGVAFEQADAKTMVLGASETGLHGNNALRSCTSEDIYDRMMYKDTLSYLPDDILAKVDRAAMAVGLETRVPMLDHRVVEFAWRLPLPTRVRKHEAKWALKRVLQRYVPATMFERPKMGFGVPVGEWVRGDLRDWAEDLLSEERLRREGFFDARVARARWSRHVDGVAEDADGVWSLLMFQAWLCASAPSASVQCVASDGMERALAF